MQFLVYGQGEPQRKGERMSLQNDHCRQSMMKRAAGVSLILIALLSIAAIGLRAAWERGGTAVRTEGGLQDLP
jgi:hypothetical protein